MSSFKLKMSSELITYFFQIPSLHILSFLLFLYFFISLFFLNYIMYAFLYLSFLKNIKYISKFKTLGLQRQGDMEIN